MSAMQQSWANEVLTKVKAFKDASATLGIAQVIKAADEYISLVNMQIAVIATMDKFQKPKDV